jgi:hypothetical protein
VTGRPWTLAVAVALALLAPGCLRAGEEPPGEPTPPSPVFVDPPPEGGGPAPCASSQAQQLVVGFTAEAIPDAGGLGVGLHRLDAATWVWVWATYPDGTQRQDRVSRANEVQTFREPDGGYVLCTRVDVVAPLEVDGRARAYDVAVRFSAHSRVPEGALRFVVNWMAGCGPCGPPRSGNDTLLSPGPG